MGLGAVITGFCATSDTSPALSTALAVAYYTLAGEKTMEDPSYSRGPGSFRQGFLDTLRNLTEDEVEKRAKVEKL